MTRDDRIKNLECALSDIQRELEEVRQEDGQESIKGMLYYVWDDNKENINLKFIKKKISRMPYCWIDNGDTEWKNAEPAWDLIWILCNPPVKARWVACDGDGSWYFFEYEPILYVNDTNFKDDSCNGGMWEIQFTAHPDWKNSKMKRPEGI